MRKLVLIVPGLCFLPLFAPPPALAQGAGAKAAPEKQGSKKEKKQAERKAGKKKTKPKEAEEPSPNQPEFERLKAEFEAQKGKDPLERVLMIERFGDFPTEETVPFLDGILTAEKELTGIVGAVVRALGKIGTQEAVAAILERGVPVLIGDINMLSVAIAFQNPIEDDAEDLVLRTGLTEAVRRDREALKTMIAAIAGLRSVKKVTLLSAELARAASPEVRVIILKAFRDSKPAEVARIVHPYLRDPDLQVQVAVLQVLEALEARNYFRDYEKLLRSPHWQVRVLAVDLLAMSEHQNIVRLLIPLLDDPEPRVRVGAIQTLSAAGGDAVVEPLIKALGRNQGRVLDDLADALARITGKDFGLNAVQWESWWAANKGQVKIERIPAKEYAKLKEAKEEVRTQVAGYFGLRVISKHVAFVFDCSESMLEAYVPPGQKPPDEPEEKAEPGKTTAVDPKKKGTRKGPKRDLTTKIELAKRELLQVLAKLPLGVMVNIVRFNTFVEPCKPALTELKDATRAEFTTYVQAAKPEGLTNLYGALEEVLKDEKVDTIYLLSDGAPSVGTFIETDAVLAEVAKLNQLRKVKINTIGFHMKPEELAFMEALADQNSGVFLQR